MNYDDFLKSKLDDDVSTGMAITADPHYNAKPHQRDCLEMLLNIGRGAAFLDTGLGKTFLQIDWARHIPGKVLIVAPLAVAHQTIREAKNLLGIEVVYSKEGELSDGITITNYERIHHFDAGELSGIVLDESSILKGKNSKTKKPIVEQFNQVPYRLACTATPSPNDYTELGNHAEFLGLMSTQEMLTKWFLHDSANTGDWRLKKHAVESFWQWVSSWACCVSKPSDLGHSDEGYDLPELTIKTHTVETALESGGQEMLFDIPTINATDLHRSKRGTMDERCKMVADMVNDNDRPWLVWCESNDESALLAKLIPDSVEVKGSNTPDQKEDRLLSFTDQKSRVLVSKSSICGFGMNWQHCRDIAFASISYSYEKFYQAVRRSWRFGQDQEVRTHVVLADSELPVWRAIEKKTINHDQMKKAMRESVFSNSEGAKVKQAYNAKGKGSLPSWI